MDNHCHQHEHTLKSGKDELVALIEYMVKHNASHAKELSELAEMLGNKDESEAYGLVKEALLDFEAANEKLSLALKVITGR